MLEFQNVVFQYAQDNAKMLNGLSFCVEKEDFISIIGTSGCGKSTIFRLINGLEKAQEGNILFQGKSVYEQKNYSAYMPQKDLLFAWRTIGQNVCLPMQLQKIEKKEQQQRGKEILKEVGLLDYWDKYPRDLSGGMKQRVSFARTLLTGCELLLLDEPFSALDYFTKISLQEWLLHQWAHFHKTILFITHDVEEAILISKKIFVIQDRPVTKFREILVPLKYPRKRSDLLDREMIKLKEELIFSLRQDVTV